MLETRECVLETIGFSPNELVYGYAVHGPLTMLKENQVEAEPPMNIIDCVNSFIQCLLVIGGMKREKF